MTEAASPSNAVSRPSRRAVFARRLATTLALWAVLVVAAVTGNRWMFFSLLLLFGGAALVEWRRLFALPGPLAAWLYLISAGYAISLFVRAPASAAGPGLSETIALPFLLLGLFLLVMRRPLGGRESLWVIFSAVFGFLYLPLLLSFLWRLLQFHAEPGPGGLRFAADSGDGPLRGVLYAVHVIAVTKFTDMGAYFFGMLLGRHQMIPHISPGKTWEGLAGGFFGAFLASHLIVALWPDGLALLDHRHAAVLAAGIALVTIVADLTESVIKRCVGVKDSGNSLPGIGGALDLIDSLLFTAPLAWAYLRLIAV
jgi:phosphatidate cytidylyltransferase